MAFITLDIMRLHIMIQNLRTLDSDSSSPLPRSSDLTLCDFFFHMEVRQSSCFCITVKPKNIEELKIKTAESMMTEMLKKKISNEF